MEADKLTLHGERSAIDHEMAALRDQLLSVETDKMLTATDKSGRDE